MKEFQKLFFLTLGSFFFLLGIIGVILPIIPGIPFLLVSLVFLVRGSKKILKFLLRDKYFGKYLKKLRKDGLSKKVRNYTLILVWTTHIISVIYIENILIKTFLLSSLIMVTIILIKIKTKEYRYFNLVIERKRIE